MTYYTLSYTFTEQAGPAYYSEQTDEEFYDTEDFDWDYEVSELQIAEAFIDIYGRKENTLEENCKLVVQELMTEEDLKQALVDWEAKDLDEAIAAIKANADRYNERMEQDGKPNRWPKDARLLLDGLLGDISYYKDEHEDELTEYFEEEAHEDFRENYNN